MSAEYGTILQFSPQRGETSKPHGGQGATDYIAQLQAWDREEQTRFEMGAVTPADIMLSRIFDTKRLPNGQSDETTDRAFLMGFAFASLAHDQFSDEGDYSYKDSLMRNYASWQLMTPERGFHHKGIALSHEEAITLQWTLQQVNIDFDPGIGELCVPLSPLNDDIRHIAKQPYPSSGYTFANEVLKELEPTLPTLAEVSIPEEPAPVDPMVLLQSWNKEDEAKKRADLTPADIMLSRICKAQSAIYDSADPIALERIRDIRFAFTSLAFDHLSDEKQKGNNQLARIIEYAILQHDYLQRTGYKRGGITLSQEEATMLSFTLAQAGIPYDEPEGDICIPFAPLDQKLLTVARFRPHELTSSNIETAFTLPTTPTLQPIISTFPHPERAIPQSE